MGKHRRPVSILDREEGLRRVKAMTGARTDSGCMPWLGSTKNGFGCIKVGGVRHMVHHLLRPDIQPLYYETVCRSKTRCNPSHWYQRDAIDCDSPEYKRGWHLQKAYKMSLAEADVMLSRGCDICRTLDLLRIDHDHTTNIVRGVLCHKHNTGLGMLGDTLESLQHAWKYVTRPGVSLLHRMPVCRRKKDPQGTRDRHLRVEYNINIEAFQDMYKRQGGLCALCSKAIPNSGRGCPVDHIDWLGAKVIRGVLCMCCNTGLGRFGDCPEGLKEAVGYLERARIRVGDD